MHNDIIFNKTTTFDLSNVSFGELPKSVLYNIFKDGRAASKFLEQLLPYWFNTLTFVDKHGYDHIDKHNNKYDLKGFTKFGAKYAPSNMLGAGRRINLIELHNHAANINYIFSDITKFPQVHIICKKGTDLVRDFPSGMIKPNERDKLFTEEIMNDNRTE